MGPLEGLRVLDLTRLQPGNYATMLMADLGADVIKLEEPGRGDYVRWWPPMVGLMSAAHRILNRNKRSVTVNLRHAEGANLLLRLVSQTDVLIESFRPGVMDRLGVGYSRLSEVNPKLIYAALTGYGQDGPYRDRAGHDINYIALAGVLDKTGLPKGPPALPSVQLADLSGAMMAVIGVLAAVFRRESTGEGEFVDVSMLEVAISWLALQLAPWLAGEPEPDRGAAYLSGGYPSYRVYECADGKYLSVGALEPQFWEGLCRALGLDQLALEPIPDPERRREIHQIFEETFKSQPRRHWVELLSPIDACVAPVNSFEEMAADPQVLARRMLVDRAIPEAPAWRELGMAVRLKREPGASRLPAPELGEHNREIFGDLGLSPSDLDHLAAQGAI
jgi:crotonobetainyl-CoA:carnitine CoA-transferase CaiB-like acyl-CoA transferase